MSRLNQHKTQRPGSILQPAARAFTLIEIMVSLVIVTMIVMVVGNMFDQSSDTWHIGMSKSEVNNAGRAVLDLITTDLTQAFAGRVEHAGIPGAVENILFYQDSQSHIAFACFRQVPDNIKRDLLLVEYTLESGVLKRKIKPNDFKPHLISEQWDITKTDNLLEGVEAFRVQLYNDDFTLFNGSEMNTLPPYADIMIELLPSSVKDTLDSMSAGQAEYRKANVVVFTTRVYFRNRTGFLPRRI